MLRQLIFASSIRKPHAIWTQSMSQYPPMYVEPVVEKENQEKLKETGEFKSLAHTPIRAAENSKTSSILYDKTLSKFVNYIMEGGKKQLAREVLEKGMEKIKRIQLERHHLATEEEKPNIELNPRVLFKQAVENCRPALILMPIKRGGTVYKVPVPITEKASYFRSMKWLLESINDKPKTVHFPEKFAWEIIDAANNTGRVVKRKQDLHKECEANRAYAHYRWK